MYENLLTENFYCAKVSMATRVMALYKYFKPILPDPNGELPGSISASKVAVMNKEVRQETAGSPVAMPKNTPLITSKLNHITPMETNLIIDMVPRIQLSHSYSTVKSATIVLLKH